MKLYTKDRKEIKVIRSKMPKLKSHRGRTWDEGTTMIDGIKVICWIDTTWGKYFYFLWDLKGYKISINDVDGNTHLPTLTTKR